MAGWGFTADDHVVRQHQATSLLLLGPLGKVVGAGGVIEDAAAFGQLVAGVLELLEVRFPLGIGLHVDDVFPADAVGPGGVAFGTRVEGGDRIVVGRPPRQGRTKEDEDRATARNRARWARQRSFIPIFPR